MTEFSGAGDKAEFDGNTLLLECEDNEFVYTSGIEISKFKTDDKTIDYISFMGNNMIPYTFAIGEKNTYFISTHYKFIENNKIDEGTLLNTTNNNLDPFDYHLEKYGQNSFKTLDKARIHSFYLDSEENAEDEDNIQEDVNIHELEYTHGSNEVVKVFNQKCVICLEWYSDYIFKQCGHQCICEDCYQNKDDIDLLKCDVCRM